MFGKTLKACVRPSKSGARPLALWKISLKPTLSVDRIVAVKILLDALAQDLEEVVDSINYGLMLIVGRFIQRRGYSFRTEAEA